MSLEKHEFKQRKKKTSNCYGDYGTTWTFLQNARTERLKWSENWTCFRNTGAVKLLNCSCYVSCDFVRREESLTPHYLKWFLRPVSRGTPPNKLRRTLSVWRRLYIHNLYIFPYVVPLVTPRQAMCTNPPKFHISHNTGRSRALRNYWLLLKRVFRAKYKIIPMKNRKSNLIFLSDSQNMRID